MASSAEQIRNWTGPPILGYGFRPFFLSAALFAALAMAAWIGALTGLWPVPSAFGPVEWHVHEFLWGYLSAVVAGFMLTAVPNWTGRLPIAGWPLALLWGSWLIGRFAILLSGHMPPAAAAGLDLLFLGALIFVMTREIVAGRNWRNLKVVGLAGLLFAGNALFHAENMLGLGVTQGFGLRTGVASAMLLIMLVGGRIIPSFTRNWLARRPPGRIPAPFGTADKLTLAVSVPALLAWIAGPEARVTGMLLLAAGIANLYRLARWAGWRCLAEPLVGILHLAYLFVPAGFLLVGLHVFGPDAVPGSAAVHAWTGGAILLMTLAVMTRASLGHSGMPLTAGWRISGIYLLAIASALSRIAAGFLPAWDWLLHLAALCWILAFLGFAAVYAPLFFRPKAG